MTIGLFGTCGNSQWRDKFITKYEKMGIDYFNPVKDDWQPEDAQIEAEHLANDEIILFPVTDESLGLGSLGEVGFSILQAIKLDSERSVIVMIDRFINDDAKQFIDDDKIVNESIKMRALIKAHLNKLNYPNVYMVDTLDDMLSITLHLKEMNDIRKKISVFTSK